MQIDLVANAKSVQFAVSMENTRIGICLPAPLHPFSRVVLDLYLAGAMPTSEFRRWFHMPNSDYLRASDCIAQIVDPAYVPEVRLPARNTLKTPEFI
jgi:hypothetical protein